MPLAARNGCRGAQELPQCGSLLVTTLPGARLTPLGAMTITSETARRSIPGRDTRMCVTLA